MGIPTWALIPARTHKLCIEEETRTQMHTACTHRPSRVDGSQQPALVPAGRSGVLPARVFVEHPGLLKHPGG